MSLYKGTTIVSGLPTGLINTVNEKLDLTGGEITGSLNFNLTSNHKPIIINMDNTTGSVGENLQDIDFRLSNNRIGMIRCNHLTTGNNSLQLYLYDNNGNAKETFGMTYESSTGKVTYNRPQLIATYSDGAFAGYRIWSDGYCEQWSQSYNSSASQSGTVVSLFKTFANTNYSLTGQVVPTLSDSASQWWRLYATSTSTITISTGWTNSSNMSYTDGSVRWIARGYLASGQY